VDGFAIGLLVIITLVIGVLLIQRFNTPYSGEIEVAEDENGGKVFSLVLYSDPEELEKMKKVTFKIKTDNRG
jgi:hypothetical protein